MIGAIDEKARDGRQADELDEDVIEEASSLHNSQGASPHAELSTTFMTSSRLSQVDAPATSMPAERWLIERVQHDTDRSRQRSR